MQHREGIIHVSSPSDSIAFSGQRELIFMRKCDSFECVASMFATCLVLRHMPSHLGIICAQLEIAYVLNAELFASIAAFSTQGPCFVPTSFSIIKALITPKLYPISTAIAPSNQSSSQSRIVCHSPDEDTKLPDISMSLVLDSQLLRVNWVG